MLCDKNVDEKIAEALKVSLTESEKKLLAKKPTDDLRAYDFPGGRLDVRENVRFRGGHFPAWVHQSFPRSGCALAIEIKKFFMDEWTGEPDQLQLDAVGEALKSTVPGVLEELGKLG